MGLNLHFQQIVYVKVIKMEPINKDKLELKYHLNVYKILNEEPTATDLLYELSNDDDILSGKEVTLNHIKHSLSFKIDNDKLENLLRILIKQNYILNVQNNKKTNNYKLIDHPWK